MTAHYIFSLPWHSHFFSSIYGTESTINKNGTRKKINVSLAHALRIITFDYRACINMEVYKPNATGEWKWAVQNHNIWNRWCFFFYINVNTCKKVVFFTIWHREGFHTASTVITSELTRSVAVFKSDIQRNIRVQCCFTRSQRWTIKTSIWFMKSVHGLLSTRILQLVLE